MQMQSNRAKRITTSIFKIVTFSPTITALFLYAVTVIYSYGYLTARFNHDPDVCSGIYFNIEDFDNRMKLKYFYQVQLTAFIPGLNVLTAAVRYPQVNGFEMFYHPGACTLLTPKTEPGRWA